MAITQEVLFTNPEYMKRITPITGAIDDSYLVPAIISAQDVKLQAYLGTRLFNALRAKVQTATLSGAYETLLDSYVRKCVTWWAIAELIPSLVVQMDNGGLVQRTPENTSPISAQQMAYELTRARNKAQFYTRRMYSYICNNTASFPEYSQNTGSDMCPIVPQYGSDMFDITGRGIDREYLRKFIG
jgi:hypothetical protein